MANHLNHEEKKQEKEEEEEEEGDVDENDDDDDEVRDVVRVKAHITLQGRQRRTDRQ